MGEDRKPNVGGREVEPERGDAGGAYEPEELRLQAKSLRKRRAPAKEAEEKDSGETEPRG